MFNKTKKIIDERQELQSLKNAKICWIVLIILLALSINIQSLVYSLDFAHFLPECFILIFTCLLNLILEIRQGILYTKDVQNTKRNFYLYLSFSLFFSFLLGIGNYLKWHLESKMIAVIVISTFLIMLSLMLAIDYLYRAAAKKRIKTLENQMLSATDLDEQDINVS